MHFSHLIPPVVPGQRRKYSHSKFTAPSHLLAFSPPPANTVTTGHSPADLEKEGKERKRRKNKRGQLCIAACALLTALSPARCHFLCPCFFKSLDSFVFFWWANRLTRPRHLSAQLTSAVAPALQALSHSLSLPSLSCSGAVLRNRQCAATCPVQSPPQREESHSRRFVSTPYLTSLLRYT